MARMRGLVALAFWAVPNVAFAAEGRGGASPFSLAVTLALLSLVPLVFMTTTSFVKISVVFSILRNAIGLASVPSGTVIAAFAAILTLYVMAPVGDEIRSAAAPSLARLEDKGLESGAEIKLVLELIGAAREPLRGFMERNAGKKERALFLSMAKRVRKPEQRAQVSARDFLVLLPAFLITELGEAFQIGFFVFLPFLVVDMIVANVLLALGMHMLSPTTISLPFKLLLFVMVEGWYLLSRALVFGYA